MPKPVAIIGQVILYGAFAAFIGYFATSPKYHQVADDVALIKLSISHLGERECRKRSPEELAKMPPNMRAPLDCPRERSDIRLEVDLDGQPILQTVMHPTGLYKDGVSTIYRRFEVKAGSHQLAVRMNDNLVKPGFNFVKEERISLKPHQVMVIDFNPDQGGLFFR
ncbi:MAG TPA: hypothetical protein PK440_12020 [Candidatus Accumulibacter phosphatis]|nr:MAG: hypothetical protein AW07_03294 [Candidatus Accumulibacter sp. SK-11]HAY28382.1 hypothetical protein [Accumulibacter sp.]HRL77214.1 hypothetical protein [Candidatus Accumulibacter phosphatis]HCN66878.1 hypothetical protein [Accumulibacter sp.]HCV13945.1 hypothetical protein [Accumulibacter sp.]